MISEENFNSAINWFIEQVEGKMNGWCLKKCNGYNTLSYQTIIQLNKSFLQNKINILNVNTNLNKDAFNIENSINTAIVFTDDKIIDEMMKDQNNLLIEDDNVKDIKIHKLKSIKDVISLSHDKDDLIIVSDCLTLKVEIQILYHISFQVPVLYYNVYNTGGQLITINQLWNILSHKKVLDSEIDFWSLITQQENPCNGRPYFYLHPCHTFQLMKNFLDKKPHSKGYLITWLSTVMRYTLVDIPSNFYQQILQNI